MALSDIRCRGQFDSFREVLGSTYLGLEFLHVPNAQAFSAEFRTRSVGPLTATLARTWDVDGVMAARRNRQHIAADTDAHVVLMLLRAGRVRHTQYGRTAELEPGCAVLIDSREPHFVEQHGAATCFTLRLPLDLLRTALPVPERCCGIGIDARHGFNAVLGDLLLASWRRAGDMSARDAASTTAHVLDAVSSLCLAQADKATASLSASSLHFDRAVRFIATRIGDPTLDPATIAAALRISRGHLHAIMREQGTSIGRLLLDMRLDRCRADIADARQRDRTITRIALDWGFCDAAHFSRAFRARFGMTPREFRATAAAGNATPATA